MQKILESFINGTDNLQFRRIFEYLLNIRNQARLGDYIFLTIGTFIVYYLFFFRLRLHFEYGTVPKKSKKRSPKYCTPKNTKKKNEEPTFLRWLYMLDSYSFSVYKLKHPKTSKITYIYNAITVSTYICTTLLIIPSLFSTTICNIFMDIVFLHIYINVIPMGLYNFIHFFYKKNRHIQHIQEQL